MDTRTLKKIYNKLSEEDKTKLSTEKIELANVKDIPKYENTLKDIQRKIREFEQFKREAKPEILRTVKWLNEIKSDVLAIGMKYQDIKGLNELNDLYFKVNTEAREANII